MQDSVIGGKIEAVCEALGVEKEHIRVLTPLPKEQDQNVQALNEEIEYPGVSVVIFRRPCIHVLGKRRKEGRS
jgi:indolepyruvate ferredoxin oxidoreductase alpha subunit